MDLVPFFIILLAVKEAECSRVNFLEYIGRRRDQFKRQRLCCCFD